MNIQSWIQFITQIKQKFNLQTLDMSTAEFTDKIKSFYVDGVNNQLAHIKETDSGKLRFFSNIHKSFELQKYFVFNLDKNLRSNLTKLRTSPHSLAIETGRYQKKNPIPADQRFCMYCKTNIENEIHFVLQCSGLSEVRNTYRSILENKSNLPEEKFITFLLNPQNLYDTKNICLFLKEMFIKRDFNSKNT